MKQKGFTLIELIVVIVILGILAATALPKFVDLGNDARSAARNGLIGAVKSAANLVYGTAAARGQTGATGAVSVGTSNISLIFGYPTAGSIQAAMQDAAGLTPTVAAPVTTWSFQTGCDVTYTESTGAGNSPAVVAVGTSC